VIDSAILKEIVSIRPDVMSGMPVFRGTRVPIEAVIVDLAGGSSLEEVLKDYPTLDRNDVELFLSALSQSAHPPKAA
jgi:uncharacterized protein (DUF433 family)